MMLGVLVAWSETHAGRRTGEGSEMLTDSAFDYTINKCVTSASLCNKHLFVLLQLQALSFYVTPNKYRKTAPLKTLIPTS
jgi:hypothetical protein